MKVLDSKQYLYPFSPLRKTLLLAFLIGSVAVVAGQFLFVDKLAASLPDTLRGGGTALQGLAILPAGGDAPDSQASLGVAEAATGQQEVALSTRTLRELRIPTLGVKAGVQDLGLTADGRMGSPTNHYEVGWFRYGTKPGARGNAVIAGHVNTLRSSEGVFKELHLLKAGDTVEVTDRDGHTSIFIVTGTKRVPYDAPVSANAEIFGPTMARRLNLVTCSGSWIPEKKTYTERLVVFTELVD